MLLAGLMCLPAMLAADEDDTWTVNIRDADIKAFINKVSEMTGRNFVVDPRVRARDVTVISRAPLTSDEVYELFLSVLEVHGYSAVPSGQVTKIVPDSTAKQRSLPFDDDGTGPGEALITRVITVQQTPAEELVPVLRPLVPQYGHLAAVSSANALIISDHANNVRRLETIIAHLDGTERQEMEIIALQHAWVGDVLAMLEALTPEEQTGRRGSIRPGSRLSMVADERTNRLVLQGDRDARERARELVRELDVPSSETGGVQVIRLHHSQAEDMAELLERFVEGAEVVEGEEMGERRRGKAAIQADPSMNSLVVRAEPGMMQELKSVIRQLDQRRAQILIEAAIVEVGGDRGRDLGFQWLAGDQESGVGGINFSGAAVSVNDVVQSVLTGEPTTGLGDGLTIGGGDLDGDGRLRWGGFLQALDRESDVNLLSTPSILTLDNQEASIVVGENVPFITGQTTGQATDARNPFQTIQREDVGITLKVKPSLAGPNTVRLELEQESSAVRGAVEGVDAADLITSMRTIDTTVLADDGETIVLGGLIQDDHREVQSKVPLLGDIPLLGMLFRFTSTDTEKRNLVVFIRPTILADNERLVQMTRERYLGITALQFRLDRHGELRRTVPSPLPVDVDDVFDGRDGVPQAVQEYAEDRIYPEDRWRPEDQEDGEDPAREQEQSGPQSLELTPETGQEEN